jgi:hypothetical protein
MRRLLAGLAGKKGWALLTLILVISLWFTFRGEGAGKDRGPSSAVPGEQGVAPEGREPALREWKLAPFWLPREQSGPVLLYQMEVNLQISPAFAPEGDGPFLVGIREVIWKDLISLREMPPSRPVRIQWEQTLCRRLNDAFFQGTLKGVRLEAALRP